MVTNPISVCWIRVLPSTKLTTKFLPLMDAAYVEKVRPFGQVPPFVFTAGAAQDAGTFWSADPSFAGDPKADAVFDFGPAFADQAAALAWIDSPAGRTWAAESTSYQLLSTWPENAFTVVGKKPVNTTGSTTDKFPNDQWREAFAHLHESKPEIELFKPADFATLSAYPAPGAECAELARLADPKIRTPERIAEIATQAQSAMHAIQPVFDVVGIDLLRPPALAAIAAVNIVGQNISHTVFHFKVQFNRARPWNACNSVKPLWSPDDRLFPAHASYPSGHATAAFAWAYYLSAHFPDDEDALLGAARRVAKNREIAGVHFPSDSRAGEDLGMQMATHLFAAEEDGRLNLQAFVALGRSTGG